MMAAAPDSERKPLIAGSVQDREEVPPDNEVHTWAWARGAACVGQRCRRGRGSPLLV